MALPPASAVNVKGLNLFSVDKKMHLRVTEPGQEAGFTSTLTIVMK